MARPFDLIIFDCDSTLSTIEGVDELAERKNVGAEVAHFTNAAMDGDLALEDVYTKRMDLIRPSREDVEWLGQRYCDTIVPGAREVVAQLLVTGRAVHIVSGGIQQSINQLADALHIPLSDVVGVPVHFSDTGDYAGFDTGTPTARSGGKAEIIARLIAEERNAVMIGDGVTDLEAQRVGVPTIGFGGVVARAVVRERADAWVEDASLIAVLRVIEELENSLRL